MRITSGKMLGNVEYGWLLWSSHAMSIIMKIFPGSIHIIGIEWNGSEKPGNNFLSTIPYTFEGHPFFVQDHMMAAEDHLLLGFMTFHGFFLKEIYATTLVAGTMYLMRRHQENSEQLGSWIRCLIRHDGHKISPCLYIWMMFLREWKSWILPCLFSLVHYHHQWMLHLLWLLSGYMTSAVSLLGSLILC